jgi:hypothetical protein
MSTEAQIRDAIRDGKTIRLVAPMLNVSLSRRLEYVLQSLVGYYERPELGDCLHACVFELATNASRANMKHAFFLERGLDGNDPEAYRLGVREFKTQRENQGWHRRYRQQVKELNLTLEIIFRHCAHGLRIEVINNLPLRPQEERRIRDRFGEAMRASNIYEFFTDHGDDSEGQGLGFAMNVLFLRSENIDPGLLRIGSSDGRTVARLEVPLSPSFVSARGEYYHASRDGRAHDSGYERDDSLPFDRRTVLGSARQYA